MFQKRWHIKVNILANQNFPKNALKEFIDYLSTFEHFKNLYYNKKIYSDLRNFHGATHTSSNTGDTIIEVVLQ